MTREQIVDPNCVLPVKVRQLTDEHGWRDLFSQAAFPHMTQAWAFGEAKRVTGWHPQRLVFTCGTEPVAICQVLYKRILGIPLVARINQGPMMLRGHEYAEFDVNMAVRSHWRYGRRGILLISSAVPSIEADALVAAGFRRRGNFQWTSSRVDLTRSEDDMRRALDGKWRGHLKKSESHGLEFLTGSMPEDADWIVGQHIKNMADKHFEGPAPALLAALYRAAPSDFLVMRVLHDGQAIAGAVAFKFGLVAHYYIGCYGDESRKLSGGNFLLWNMALELKRRGCEKFDLGGHNNASGFGGFKLGMKGEMYQSAGEFISI